MGRTVMLNEEVKLSLTRERCAPLWMAAVMLAITITWASETEASPDQARHPADAQQATTARNLGSDEFDTFLPRPGGRDKSIQLAQATTGDTGALQQPPERQLDWTESLSCELALARRDIALLQHLEQEHDRAEWLVQGLDAERREVEIQKALLAKAVEEASRLKEASRLNQAGESNPAELQALLQEERERSARLEQDLAAARRDVETQTALATKASEEASQVKQAAESSVAELKKSLQRERERSARHEQYLAAARRDVETQTAPTKAGAEASQLKQAAESSVAELQNSVQQESERSARLEQDLAAARRDIDAQTALAAKAGDEVGRLTLAAKADAAEQKRSMQKEHERADALAQDLSMARTKIYAYEAQAAKASEDAAQLKKTEASATADLEQSQQRERERAEQLARDLAKASRDLDVETQRAAKASEEVIRIKQAEERDSAELRSSLQRERERVERLENDLVLARHNNDALLAKYSAAAFQLATTGRAGREAPPAAPEPPVQNQPVQDEPVQDKQAQDKPIQDQAIAARSTGDAQFNPDEGLQVARLLARAGLLLEQGDIGAARIVLEHVAAMGNAQAIFALAETYDPLILPNFGTYGTRGDATRARDLYAQAEAGGIKEAKARFEALRR